MGNYISEKEIWAETPSFEEIGPKVAEVTISMNK